MRRIHHHTAISLLACCVLFSTLLGHEASAEGGHFYQYFVSYRSSSGTEILSTGSSRAISVAPAMRSNGVAFDIETSRFASRVQFLPSQLPFVAKGDYSDPGCAWRPNDPEAAEWIWDAWQTIPELRYQYEALFLLRMFDLPVPWEGANRVQALDPSGPPNCEGGGFRVHEIEYTHSGELHRFAADFKYLGRGAKRIRGMIRYNASSRFVFPGAMKSDLWPRMHAPITRAQNRGRVALEAVESRSSFDSDRRRSGDEAEEEIVLESCCERSATPPPNPPLSDAPSSEVPAEQPREVASPPSEHVVRAPSPEPDAPNLPAPPLPNTTEPPVSPLQDPIAAAAPAASQNYDPATVPEPSALPVQDPTAAADPPVSPVPDSPAVAEPESAPVRDPIEVNAPGAVDDGAQPAREQAMESAPAVPAPDASAAIEAVADQSTPTMGEPMAVSAGGPDRGVTLAAATAPASLPTRLVPADPSAAATEDSKVARVNRIELLERVDWSRDPILEITPHDSGGSDSVPMAPPSARVHHRDSIPASDCCRGQSPVADARSGGFDIQGFLLQFVSLWQSILIGLGKLLGLSAS